MVGTVAIVATLDTKGIEIAFLKERIEELGCTTLVIDVGVFDPAGIRPDISRHEIAAAADSSITRIIAAGQKRLAFLTMSKGVARKIDALHKAGRFQAVVSVAGGTGTHLIAGALQALPIGVPKLIVTTVASRDVSSIIGCKDVTLMHAVGDIIGLNFLTKGLLTTAAGAIAGMITTKETPPADRRVIGLTSFSPLNACTFSATAKLRGLGYEVIPFHAVGSGSMAMESLIEEGVLQGVLDLSLHEFVDWLHGGYCRYIGPGRLETAGRMGIPQVILPGGLDMIVFEGTALEEVPPQLRDRPFLQHDFRSLLRSNTEDLTRLASLIAEKANRAKRPPTFVIPSKGWSSVDAPGKPFYDPELNRVFISELKSFLNAQVRVVEVAANINDEESVRVAVNELHAQFGGRF